MINILCGLLAAGKTLFLSSIVSAFCARFAQLCAWRHIRVYKRYRLYRNSILGTYKYFHITLQRLTDAFVRFLLGGLISCNFWVHPQHASADALSGDTYHSVGISQQLNVSPSVWVTRIVYIPVWKITRFTLYGSGIDSYLQLVMLQWGRMESCEQVNKKSWTKDGIKQNIVFT